MAELQRRMSSREFAEWLAFFELEPFGEERADLRAAIVARTIAEVNRDRKKRSRPFRLEEFMPKFGEEKPERTPESMLRTVEQLNAAFGGKDLRRK